LFFKIGHFKKARIYKNFVEAFMKKLSVCLLAALTLTVVLSCASTKPADAAFSPVIEGEITQKKVNDTLTQIYDKYRSSLDLSGAAAYVVKKGDTLSGITRNAYGTMNGFYFPLIMMASNQDIVDPDLIEPSMSLVIPDLRKNLDNPAARQAIKDCLKDVAYVYNKKGDSATEKGLQTLADSL
jgi:hypothetical protein